MAEDRPKLVLVPSPGIREDDVARLLGGQYALQILPAASADPFAGLALRYISDGVALCLPSGEAVWTNPRYAAIDDHTRTRIAELCTQVSQWRPEPTEPGSATGAARPSAGASGGPGDPMRPLLKRFDVAGADGSRFYEVLITAVVDRSIDGSPVPTSPSALRVQFLAILVHDVSAQRRIQTKIDAIDQAGSALVRFEPDVVRKLNPAERLGLLESKIIRYSRDLLHFDHFAVRLTDEKTSKLELIISSGLPREATELDLYAQREGNGISGFVAATGRSYNCPDTSRDDRYLPGLTNARSSLTVPLRLHDKIIGIFNVESAQTGGFSEDDRQFAEIFGRYMAMALHMLDLLVVERSTTNQAVTGTVQGELSEPLQDILKEAEVLTSISTTDPETARHIDRIRADVEAIRRRVQNVATGPQTLLGVERAMADTSKDPILDGKNILVADDEARIRRIIGDVLRHRGCTVTVCENGAVAITAIEALAAKLAQGDPSARPFDAVLSDIKMPDRNGYEVFAAARRMIPGVPVILMTGFGYDPHHSIVRASQEGLQSVLFKPFEVERMLDEVRKAVSKPAAPPPSPIS